MGLIFKIGTKTKMPWALDNLEEKPGYTIEP